MAKELHKCVVNYFTHLEKVDFKWKELCTTSERPLQALANQSEQLRLATSTEVNDAELCKVEGLHERLIFKILMGIENEVALLLDISRQLNNMNQDLKNRLIHLENTRSKVSIHDDDMKEFVNGTPYRPRLNLLLEWATDGFVYYHELYVNIIGNVKSLDYKNVESIENLANSFIENRFKRARIDRILNFTQFLRKETPR